MKLKLPITKTWQSTLQRWTAELRKVDAVDISTFEDWLTWSPSYSCSGTMTYTSVNTIFARYLKIGKLVHFKIRAIGTTGGVASTTIYATLPYPPMYNDEERFPATIVDAATAYVNASIAANGTTEGLLAFGVNAAGGNWSLGAGRIITSTGFYQAL